MTLHPMVTFSGNCRKALEFYRDCFGGELTFETLPDGLNARLPQHLQHLVLHARLVSPMFTIYASDLGETTAKGRISLLLEDTHSVKIETIFQKLSKNAMHISAPAKGQIGSVVDQFGVEWLFRQ